MTQDDNDDDDNDGKEIVLLDFKVEGTLHINVVVREKH